MSVPVSGRVGCARGCPSVRDRIVSPAGARTPYDHFSAGPHCGTSRNGCACGAHTPPTIGTWIVSPAIVETSIAGASAPDDHFSAGPHCGMTESTGGRIQNAGGCPSIIDAPCCIGYSW
jgi:hypothetical protein